MKRIARTKLLRQESYLAEVPVEFIETEDEWSPYLSLDDAYKLDNVREALRSGDLESAARVAKVYTLTPVHL